MTDVTSSVTLIVPTVYHRARLFAQTLRYFSRCGWRGPIVVSDHSPAAHLDVIAALVRPYADLNITLRTDPPEAHFLDRLAGCAQAAQTDYVHLHADDDFVVFPTLGYLHALMAADPSCAAAMGLNIHFQFGKHRLAVMSKAGIPDTSAGARLISQLENFSSVLYALRRRTEFIDSMSYAVRCCPDVQFWQYLESCAAVLTGKVTVIEDLHYVRQIHPDKWSAQLVKERSPDHFPSLILSPHFHPRLSAFRTALIDLRASRGLAVEPDAIDDGIIHLLYRGFAAMGLPQRHSTEAPAQAGAQLARFQDTEDPAAKALSRICEIVEAPP